ncbi:hypothetical protein MMC08_001125 [Hypocenomyce scalaris]|nr:hypothetical protein [Hypocenomyce scalaris]
MAQQKTMRAAQFHADTQSLRVNEIPIPTASGVDMLVKIVAASLCHSDLMPIEGNSPMTTLDANAKPVTIGHEGVGIIQAVGDKVKGFKPGDRVGFLATKNACSPPKPKTYRSSNKPK